MISLKRHLIAFEIFLAFSLVVGGCANTRMSESTAPLEMSHLRMYVAIIEQIIVNGRPVSAYDQIPKDLKEVKVLAAIETREIPDFEHVRRLALFKISSVRRHLFYTASFIGRDVSEDYYRIWFSWIVPKDDKEATYGGKIEEVRNCLRIWNQGDKCVLEYQEPVIPGSSVTTH